MCGQIVSGILGDFAETILRRDTEIGGLADGEIGRQVFFYLVFT